MCIMQVRPGQHHTTIVQACLHNLNTLIDDLGMMHSIVHHDGQHQTDARLSDTMSQLRGQRDELLSLYGEMVAAEVHDINPELAAGNEDLIFEVNRIVMRDIDAANRYATRGEYVPDDVMFTHHHDKIEELVAAPAKS